MRWTGLLPAAILTLLLAAACPDDIPPIGPTDGGGTADGGGDDGGTPPPSWPEATEVLVGAREPALSRAPDGTLTLTYVEGGKLWARRPALGGTPVELGDVGGINLEVHVAAHPTDDRLFVIWSGGRAVTLTAGVPDGPAFLTYADDNGASTGPRGAAWLGDQPVVFAQTGEVWSGSDVFPEKAFAFTVPLANPGQLPLPSPTEDVLLQPVWNSFHYYEEAFRAHDRGDGTLLTFFPRSRNHPSDPFGVPTEARWRLLHPDGTRTGARGNFLVGLGGDLTLPEPAASWIQLWQLGTDRWALTWGSSRSSLVFDVWVVGVSLDASGVPTLEGSGVNVSSTPGATQNSDHPLLRPTGDGRFWLAWRESDYGPRVALLSESLQPTTILAPTVNFPCDLESSVGAEVDAQGTLHLVATVIPGGDAEVRYWQLPLP